MASFFKGEAYRTTSFVASTIWRMALGRSADETWAIWASMFLAISVKTPSPSGDRRSSRRPIVGRQPARGLVGSQGVLFPLAQGDDVKVAHVALEGAQPGIAVFHELFVEPDRGVDVTLLLITFGLIHLRGQSGKLRPVVLVH